LRVVVVAAAPCDSPLLLVLKARALPLPNAAPTRSAAATYAAAHIYPCL